MADHEFRDLVWEGFEGKVREDCTAFLNELRLEGLSEELKGENVRVLSKGRHCVSVLPLGGTEETLSVAVKAFGRQQAWKDRYDQRRGTKAERSFRAAVFLESHGVGTPQPIGYLNRWQGSRLVESYYFSSYVEGLTSFKRELIRIYQDQPECAHFVSLLEQIGRAVRKMHEAGFCHRDLGNQNMEFANGGQEKWGEIQFMDLNRGRILPELSLQERARDFSRLHLPSEFLNVLVQIYWQGVAPKEFSRTLDRQRQRFYWWGKTRGWRHPFRKRFLGNEPRYPRVQDIWIWDTRSAQASVVMARKEKLRYYPRGRYWHLGKTVLKNFPGVLRAYRRILPQAFQERVDLTGRFGMSLEATSLGMSKQREFLDRLGKIPVLLRFCHHEGRKQWEKTVSDLRELRASGHEVMVAILQDRRAVLEPDSWREFLEFVVEAVAGQVTAIELCHAVNRMKWGVHSAWEQRALLDPVIDLQRRYPEICFTGPACIDFEYHYVLTALEEVPKEIQFGALSHHLYVDRRGAPENLQGNFGTVQKCGLLKAIADQSVRCESRVIVSEVNWPLEGTGTWSPVGATYRAPGVPESVVHVSEEDYGYYMLRYIVLALCSGFVDQIYWWRLVSHGFGLVDERAEGGWRARPAFSMLEHFLKLLGSAVFVEKLEIDCGCYALRFERLGESEVIMCWCSGRTYAGPWPFEARVVLDEYGKEVPFGEVGEAPIYVLL